VENSDFLNKAWSILVLIAGAFWTKFESVVAAFWEGLQWPHAVLIITTLFFILCKREFKSLVGRILEVGPTGAKFHPIAPSQSATLSLAPTPSTPATNEPALELEIEQALEALPETLHQDNGIPLPSPIVFPLQMKIYEDRLRYEIQGKSDAEALAYIIPRYAIYRALHDFEEAYSLMFGGQIRFLQQLNQRLGSGFSEIEIKNMWEAHQAQCKPTFDNWTSAMYLSYLRMKGLITDLNGSVVLTARGKEFVDWMTHFGRPVDKAF
jgi:hypothetical protein